MSEPGKAVKESSEPPPPALAGKKLIVAILGGLAFGFLLQKGGVAKYNVLVGQLLLQDFTVVKIMLTGIVVGMVGIFTLNRFAKVNLHLQPTRLGAQAIGGLVFGAGFALIAYCPGTGAAALGQGSWDVVFGMAGLIAGSYLYAELSGWLKKSVEKWGEKGKVTLPDLLHLPRLPFAFAVALLLSAALVLLQRGHPR
ncbi:MAG: YeeE/YedE thiosulfate transporter family protein [Terrimicrobiaceae bacterium]